MKSIIHYRHATCIFEIDNKRILLDPVFANSGEYPPILNTKNPKRNPLVNLPVNYEELLNVDGVIVTHNHNDHFDILAQDNIPKDIPILCQNEDYNTFKKKGFNNLTRIYRDVSWLGLDCIRFIGYHGGHIFRNKLGTSSSIYLKGKESDVYITGDTLLTNKIRRVIKRISPKNVIAYGGGAKMKVLGKLTMNNKDIITLSRILPKSNIVAVHMDSINHCFDTRDMLNKLVPGNVYNVFIPRNNEKIEF